jgi:2-C-methyl-D-erythritol 2,4-cyclodiphosphate synthase
LQSEERDGARSCASIARPRGADAYGKVCAEGYELVTEDCILIAERPRIAGRRDDMRVRLAATKGVEAHRIAVRATSTDRLGFTGRSGGLAARPVVLLER